ncbi:triphosphoribosyl-dephospho-CoA synthase [Paraburkholderia sp. MMS20-SJTR3]|uniref:Triphosphoribosyl-dephospho-CoA synthase n=1 Tax=Paraburkholderia sejongensis TaxID=2886946 RepID=A0ABS8K2H5_9BURK|nr:triphosphoribosyl-dephospho-CoA synthase [Paraburkholderia sp. MMS20-SJTR3]MCC8396103.1 triphosphoribosyl-dephospho-CoA synthase [Paraburkholderia sp. MMS20-SJTR3]
MTFEPPAVPLEAARAAFLEACALDVSTPKPGNVSAQSPGHGMNAAQFLASADASADALFARGARVGQRIFDAVTRTRAAAGCNTNLGIVLLVAPLAAALDEIGAMDATRATTLTATSWRAAVTQVLAKLDVDDARLAYRAIALANPGGLGDAPEQSVHAAPTIGLRDAMQLAAERDSIARQYANGFADIFDTGLAAFAQAPADAPQAAMLNVFLAFLAGWPDSHIVRKHGLALAQSVTLAAREQHARWRATAREAARRALADPQLDTWDTELKARAINPGTSADLAVVTLFVARVLANAGQPRAATPHG